MPRWQLARGLTPYALVLPLLAFIAVGFLAPLMFMLYLALDNGPAARLLPNAATALSDWDGRALPAPSIFADMAADLRQAKAAGQINLLAKYANYEGEGLRDAIRAAAKALDQDKSGDAQAVLLAASPAWSELSTWRSLYRLSRPLTARNLLAAVDLRFSGTGAIERTPRNAANHLAILGRTIGLSIAVTAICLALGLPVAFLLATVSERSRKLLLLFVLLPFWTPILVRTTGWIVLLQTEGVFNSALTQARVITTPLPLMFNRAGFLIAMSHVLLPYMILPTLNAMLAVPPAVIRASASLGGSPLRTVRRIYLPLIAPGLRTGAFLVFILAMGFYITPALVGGPADQMMSYVIAYHTNASLNWGLASALSVVLLLVLGLLMMVLLKLLGPFNFEEGMKVG